MKKIIIISLSIVLMNCALEQETGLVGKWKNGDSYVTFTETKFTLEHYSSDISMSMSYNYYLEGDDIYITAGAGYFYYMTITHLSGNELHLSTQYATIIFTRY